MRSKLRHMAWWHGLSLSRRQRKEPLERATFEVEEHLAGFGLDSDLASHTRIGILSGGQKVKVVLGAAMWLSPHILILDEPTNYLDRDSLGALVAGLNDFGGGATRSRSESKAFSA